jgi:hypothetical protein
VSPPYSGVVIADALRDTFNDWGIMRKVFTIVVDNASANGAAIDILKDDFRLKGIFLPVWGLLFYVRCCAHITNLLVQVRLSEIGDIIDSVGHEIKYRQSFPPNWVGGISFNLIYKSDMFPLTCEMHMFF